MQLQDNRVQRVRERTQNEFNEFKSSRERIQKKCFKKGVQELKKFRERERKRESVCATNHADERQTMSE
jgi:hypothetical protein